MPSNSLIICESIHHGNTMKIAQALAETLDADLLKPSEVNTSEIAEYGLIGFGSGIYNRKHHRRLFELLDKISLKTVNLVSFSQLRASR